MINVVEALAEAEAEAETIATETAGQIETETEAEIEIGVGVTTGIAIKVRGDLIGTEAEVETITMIITIKTLEGKEESLDGQLGTEEMRRVAIVTAM